MAASPCDITCVTRTERINKALRLVNKGVNFPKDLKKELEMYENKITSKNKIIPFSLLKRIHEALISNEQCSYSYLHELLQGSFIHLPQPEICPRNPELEARIQRLKADQEEREYQRMVQHINTKKFNNQYSNFGQDVKEANKHFVLVINFVLTVAGAFAFGFKAVEYSLYEAPLAMKMLAGIILASIVALADIYFIIKTLD